MDNVLIAYEGQPLFKEQEGFHSPFKQRTSYLKLPSHDKRLDTGSNFSKTQMELKIARLRQKENAKDGDFGVEECKKSHQDGLFNVGIA
ncbi:hypothetical protein GOP47_0002737 [Adiantum capillus-veneris]|uniref:Uncharacterized protein n=1 Tax=Adiantum capillus-veneris TaxID=13818 RepID=A0A9D4VAX2_ADICA|nr:hypothetical protein GOP47_0002737 [Adiantum capillus-veneris]